MSDTENSRPGLVRAEDPSFGIDRGELDRPHDRGTLIIRHINEEECEASLIGVTVYKTVPVAGESDGRLRRLLSMSLVCLTALVLLAGMVPHVWIAIQTGNTSSLDSFIDGLIKTLVPMLTLFVGYLCGKSSQRKSKDGEQV